MKEFYPIACSVEKIEKVKIQKLHGQKTRMFLSRFAACDSKKSKFIKEQRASRLFGRLGIKAPFRKILLVGSLLF